MRNDPVNRNDPHINPKNIPTFAKAAPHHAVSILPGQKSLSSAAFRFSIRKLAPCGWGSPHIVLPAIRSGDWIHWVGTLLLLALYASSTIINDLLNGHLVTRHLVMAVVGSYTLLTHARTLGVVDRERREELGWL